MDTNIGQEQQFSNEFLRCFYWYVSGLSGFRSMAPKMQQRVTAAFDAEMPVLPQSYTAYRGIQVPDGRMDLESDFVKRRRVRFKDYFSASFSEGMAMGFLKDTGRDYGLRALFEIRTKPGMRGIIVKDVLHLIGSTNDEEELILNRLSEFNVTGMEKKQGIGSYENIPFEYFHVRMEQI